MTTYLEDLVQRAVAIEQEAFLTLTPAIRLDAKPYYYYAGEAFPYCTNRIQGLPVDHSDNSESEQFPLPRLIVRCVVGHITGAYKGELDSRINVYIPLLTPYFANRKWFQSSTFPARPDYLIYSEVVDAGGFSVLDSRGFAGVQQVGFEIQIACRFTEYIEQVYL